MQRLVQFVNFKCKLSKTQRPKTCFNKTHVFRGTTFKSFSSSSFLHTCPFCIYTFHLFKAYFSISTMRYFVFIAMK